MLLFLKRLPVLVSILGLTVMTVTGCATDGSGDGDTASQSSGTPCSAGTGSRVGRRC